MALVSVASYGIFPKKIKYLFMGTSLVALSIKNIKTRAVREMKSRKNIKIFDFNGVNVAKHWHVARYLPSLIALFLML